VQAASPVGGVPQHSPFCTSSYPFAAISSALEFPPLEPSASNKDVENDPAFPR
jgi:hypothetical protein